MTEFEIIIAPAGGHRQADTAQQACALESVWRPSLQSTKQMPALGMFNGGIGVRSGARAPRSTASIAAQ